MSLKKRAKNLLEKTEIQNMKEMPDITKIGSLHMKIRELLSDLISSDFEIEKLVKKVQMQTVESLETFVGLESLSDFVKVCKISSSRLIECREDYLKIYAQLKKSCEEIEEVLK